MQLKHIDNPETPITLPAEVGRIREKVRCRFRGIKPTGGRRPRNIRDTVRSTQGQNDMMRIPIVRALSPFVAARSRLRAFTLLELIVTLAIVGVLAAFAAPNMGTIIRNHRITTLTNEVLTEIKLARSEAIKRGTSVAICTADGLNNPLACNNTKDWRDGRAVYVDSNSNGTNDAGEAFRAGEAIADNRKIKVANSAGVAINQISFNAQGASALGDISLVVCDNRGQEFGRSIEILRVSGEARVRAARPAAGAC